MLHVLIPWMPRHTPRAPLPPRPCVVCSLTGHVSPPRNLGEVDPFRPPCIYPGCGITPTYSLEGKKPVRYAGSLRTKDSSQTVLTHGSKSSPAYVFVSSLAYVVAIVIVYNQPVVARNVQWWLEVANPAQTLHFIDTCTHIQVATPADEIPLFVVFSFFRRQSPVLLNDLSAPDKESALPFNSPVHDFHLKQYPCAFRHETRSTGSR